MRMGWDRIPENHAALGAEFFEDAVDNRSGGFFPGSGAAARPPVRWTPAQQVEFAGEGDPRPAHPLVTRRLTDGEDVTALAFREVGPEVGDPDRRRTGDIVRARLPELVEAGSDCRPRKIGEQGVDRGGLVTIGQWS